MRVAPSTMIALPPFFCVGCGRKHDGSELCPDFMARFQRYAEDACTDRLRERWGNVLAHEIKNPGSLTHRDLRLIDEAESADEVRFILSEAASRKAHRQTAAVSA